MLQLGTLQQRPERAMTLRGSITRSVQATKISPVSCSARVVLACEHEPTNTAVAHRLGISRGMVGTWRSRFLAERLDGLNEQPRPGRPPLVDDDTVADLLVRTLTPPPGTGQTWSTRSIAAESGLSQTTVSRIWRTYRIHPSPGPAMPQRGHRTLLLPTEIHDVVGLFLDPPVRVLAVSTPPPRPRETANQPAGPRTDAAPKRTTCSRWRTRTAPTPMSWHTR